MPIGSIFGWGRSQAASAPGANRAYTEFTKKVLTAGKASTGVEISAVSTHVYARAKERGVDAAGIINALTNPLKTNSIRADGSQQFIGASVTVAINVDSGKLVTVWPTKAKLAEKLRKEGTP